MRTFWTGPEHRGGGSGPWTIGAASSRHAWKQNGLEIKKATKARQTTDALMLGCHREVAFAVAAIQHAYCMSPFETRGQRYLQFW